MQQRSRRRIRTRDTGQMPSPVQAADWAMPWIPPTDPITCAALAAVDRPLSAVATGEQFDAAEFYSQFERSKISKLERQVGAAGARPEWRLEDVALIDEEDSDEEKAAYEAACVEVDGYLLMPRSLDAYTMLAYQIAAFDDEPDAPDALVTGDLDHALAWARAGVCLLQQSLPYPFTGVLRYGYVDHRSAHRLLFAYALLLRHRRPRQAAPWFRAMIYLDPNDNLGAQSFVSAGKR